MFRERLREITQRLEGVKALLLISDDGLPVDHEVVDPALDLEMLAAEVIALVREFGGNHRELDIGPVRGFQIETGEYKLLLSQVATGFYLLLITGSEASLGRARFELRRASLVLAADLEA